MSGLMNPLVDAPHLKFRARVDFWRIYLKAEFFDVGLWFMDRIATIKYRLLAMQPKKVYLLMQSFDCSCLLGKHEDVAVRHVSRFVLEACKKRYDSMNEWSAKYGRPYAAAKFQRALNDLGGDKHKCTGRPRMSIVEFENVYQAREYEAKVRKDQERIMKAVAPDMGAMLGALPGAMVVKIPNKDKPTRSMGNLTVVGEKKEEVN